MAVEERGVFLGHAQEFGGYEWVADPQVVKTWH